MRKKDKGENYEQCCCYVVSLIIADTNLYSYIFKQKHVANAC